MIVCSDCRREMACSKTGKHVHFGDGHVYVGDEFHCGTCDSNVVVTSETPIYEPGVNSLAPDKVLQMEGAQ